MNGHTETVQLLLENGADPKALHSRALSNACKNGHVDIVRLLLANGAECTDEMIKQASKHQDVVELLLRWKYRADGEVYNNLFKMIQN